MESYATPWDAVEIPLYAMGGTTAMPRKSQLISVEPWEYVSPAGRRTTFTVRVPCGCNNSWCLIVWH